MSRCRAPRNAQSVVIEIHAASAPLTAVHVLGVRGSVDVEPREPANDETRGNLASLFFIDVGRREFFRGATEPEQIQLPPQLDESALQRRGRQKQDAIEPSLHIWTMSPEDPRQHAVARRRTLFAVLQVVGFVDDDQVVVRQE